MGLLKTSLARHATLWGAALATALIVTPRAGRAAGKACDLLTAAEIQTALGQNITPLKEDAQGMCHATAPAFTVLLRLAKRAGGAGAEDKGVAMIKQMGGHVDIKTFGAMTCSTLIPPAKMVAAIGFNTTCSILKNGWVAAIEIGARAQQDLVPIDRLRPLAEKMTPRF